MKTTKNAQIGDTWFRYKQPVDALPGFKPSKSMVFAGGLLCLMINTYTETKPALLCLNLSCNSESNSQLHVFTPWGKVNALEG